MPVNNIADKNCILFIWVTYPLLKQGLDTIEAWNFKYKTCGFSWIKKNKKSDSLFWGLGYYTRSNNEICLLATKGSPKRISTRVHQVVLDKVREHSRKPIVLGKKSYSSVVIYLELNSLPDKKLMDGIAGVTKYEIFNNFYTCLQLYF